jgi:hypothetical protein
MRGKPQTANLKHLLKIWFNPLPREPGTASPGSLFLSSLYPPLPKLFLIELAGIIINLVPPRSGPEMDGINITQQKFSPRHSSPAPMVCAKVQNIISFPLKPPVTVMYRRLVMFPV